MAQRDMLRDMEGRLNQIQSSETLWPDNNALTLWTANELPLCFAFTFNVIRFAEIACI